LRLVVLREAETAGVAGGQRADVERAEPPDEIVLVEHRERAVRVLGRAADVAFTRDRRLCECRERASANAVVPVLLGRLRHLRHLVRDRGEVAELPRGPRGVVAALERRLELDGAKEELARGLARLAAEGPLPGDLEHLRRRPGELSR